MDEKLLKQIHSEAREIFQSSLEAVDPYKAIKRFVHVEGNSLILGLEGKSSVEIDLTKYDRISLVGGGKATAPMARAVEELFGKRIYSGMINVKYDFAEENIKKSLKFNSFNSEAYLALGIVLQQKGMADDALSAFQKSLNINPNNSQPYYMIGNILEEKGLIDEAILSYQRAIQIDPQFAEPYVKLGNVFHKKGRLDDAIEYFQKVIQFHPNLIQAYHGLTVSFVNKWQLTDALNICNDILRINPTDIFAYYVIGNIMMTQGKLSEAEKFFKSAIKIKPDELKSYQALLMLLSYDPKNDLKTIFSEHIKFAKQFEEPLKPRILPYK